MSYDYSADQEDVREAIEEYGISATLKRKSVAAASYDRTTGAVTPTVADVALKLIRKNYKLSQIDGTMIRRGDILGMVAVPESGVLPKQGDSIVIAGKTFEVVTVTTVQPGDIALVLYVQLRGRS